MVTWGGCYIYHQPYPQLTHPDWWSSCLHPTRITSGLLEEGWHCPTGTVWAPWAEHRETWTGRETRHTPNLWNICLRCGRSALFWLFSRTWGTGECVCGRNYNAHCAPGWGPDRCLWSLNGTRRPSWSSVCGEASLAPQSVQIQYFCLATCCLLLSRPVLSEIPNRKTTFIQRERGSWRVGVSAAGGRRITRVRIQPPLPVHSATASCTGSWLQV